MRIRSIRPEFWSSEDVAEMDWHTRLVYIGLWSYVDDNGVGRDVERLITTALFPLDEDLPESSRRTTGALRHLSEHGQITRYIVAGKRYLHVAAWTTHQRIEKASKGRYPLPTSEDAEIVEPSRSTPGALPDISPLGEGEKGRRGEGDSASRVADATAPRARASNDTAATLLAEWIDHCDNPPPSRVKGQLAKEIKTLLTEGIPYDDVRRGLAAWHTKSLHPSTLASVVHELRNPATASRARPPTDRQAEILRAEMERARIADAQDGRQEIGA